MKVKIRGAVILASGLFVLAFAGMVNVSAQDSPQKAVASRTAKFASVETTDAAYRSAIDAHNLDGARALKDKAGAFKGKVTQVFTPRSGTVAILNFDKEYKTALTAVVNKTDWGKFPDLTELVGKEVVITGKFVDFHGATQIILNGPTEVAIIAIRK